MQLQTSFKPSHQDTIGTVKDYAALENENKKLRAIITKFKEEAGNMQKTLQSWNDVFMQLSDIDDTSAIDSQSQEPKQNQPEQEFTQLAQEVLPTLTLIQPVTEEGNI